MKTTLKILCSALLVCGIVSLSSCGDDDDSGPQTASDKLVGTYKITKNTASIDGTVFFTIDDADECDRDDLIIFKNDGTGTDDAGADKCDEDDPQTEDFDWMLSENDTKISLDFGDGPDEIETFTIVTNNGTILELTTSEMDDIDGDGEDELVESEITLTKQ